MSAIITTEIPRGAHEVIRERIGAILADELRAQFDFRYDDLYSKATVYLERFKAFQTTEYPAVNVSLWKSENQMNDGRSSANLHYFLIDFYTIAKSTNANKGDQLSLKLNHQLAGACRGILMHSKYFRLRFTPPFIWNTKVSSIVFDNPESTEDKNSVAHGRMIFEVKATDLNGLGLARAIEGYRTIVTLNEEETEGYQWFGEPPGASGGFDYDLDFALD
jgi:hypothetical protein